MDAGFDDMKPDLLSGEDGQGDPVALDRLQCPCGRKEQLRTAHGHYFCMGVGCVNAVTPFTSVEATPVLISFETTDTICAPEVYANRAVYKARPVRKMTHLLRRLIYGVSRQSQVNIDRFVGLAKRSSARPSILIIGSGTQGNGTEALWADASVARTGIDIYPSQTVDYIADAHFLPFKDCTFDAVLIQAVLEHVVDPQTVVAEIVRVLKPAGVVYSEIPFMQQVHEGAYDFTRFTPLGHRRLFRHFTCLGAGGLGGPGVVLAWSLKYFLWALTRSKALSIALTAPAFLVGRILDTFTSEKALWDAPSGSYFLGTKTESIELRARDLPPLYHGFQR
jgi:SAM-dependent methyltransferase